MAVTEAHTWATPAAAPAEPPEPDDKVAMAKTLIVETIEFSDFTNSGCWDVDDVLPPIFQEASEALGWEFPYPEKK